MTGNIGPDALREEFERGVASALDPQNEEALGKGGRAETTLTSRWLYRRCRVCGHSFRVGDAVKLGPGGSVVHDGPVLNCDDPAAATAERPGDVSGFFEGLLETWPPPEGLVIRHLSAGDPLLAAPSHGFRRISCYVCGHTFRENDLVVVCPCSPLSPYCSTAIHRDPVRGLHCLDAWDPSAARTISCLLRPAR